MAESRPPNLLYFTVILIFVNQALLTALDGKWRGVLAFLDNFDNFLDFKTHSICKTLIINRTFSFTEHFSSGKKIVQPEIGREKQYRIRTTICGDCDALRAHLTDPSEKPIRDLIDAFEAELAKRTTIEEIGYGVYEKDEEENRADVCNIINHL